MKKLLYCIRGLVVAFLVWGVNGPSASAVAQTPPAEQSADEDASDQQPQDRPAPVSLDTIAVTSSRLEEPVSQTASALTVLTQEDFEQRQTTDIADQLRDVSGLHILQLGNRGDLSLLFTHGGEADHNLLLIDGVKANLGRGAFDFSDITTLGVSRIEIVRGPNAALYGSEAMSSVIQLFTLRGRGPPRATLRFRGRDRWGIRALTVEGRAKNLFNEDYEEVWGYSSPGATFLAGFRAEF